MARVQEGLGLGERDWLSSHYQYANRLAHLWWLRGLGIDAHLLLVGFLGDTEVRGPRDRAEWLAAYRVADRALGLPDRHALSPFVHHVFPMSPDFRGRQSWRGVPARGEVGASLPARSSARASKPL